MNISFIWKRNRTLLCSFSIEAEHTSIIILFLSTDHASIQLKHSLKNSSFPTFLLSKINTQPSPSFLSKFTTGTPCRRSSMWRLETSPFLCTSRSLPASPNGKSNTHAAASTSNAATKIRPALTFPGKLTPAGGHLCCRAGA